MIKKQNKIQNKRLKIPHLLPFFKKHPPPQKKYIPLPAPAFHVFLAFLDREFRIRIRTQFRAVEKTYSNVEASITYSTAPDPADPNVKNN